MRQNATQYTHTQHNLWEVFYYKNRNIFFSLSGWNCFRLTYDFKSLRTFYYKWYSLMGRNHILNRSSRCCNSVVFFSCLLLEIPNGLAFNTLLFIGYWLSHIWNKVMKRRASTFVCEHETWIHIKFIDLVLMIFHICKKDGFEF